MNCGEYILIILMEFLGTSDLILEDTFGTFTSYCERHLNLKKNVEN